MKRKVEERITELCGSHGLPAGAPAGLLSILECLAGEHAPTAVKDPADGVDVHIADALSGLESPEVRDAGVIADIGSGCGIPGLVIALARPSATVYAVEASARRCQFIEDAASAAAIGNIEAIKSRAEEWSGGIGRCDVVIARAVAPLAVLAEYAAPLLRMGGTLVAWKGSPDRAELDAASRAAELLGLDVLEPIVVEPWPAGGTRSLHRLRKETVTPEVYPRRAGMAAKRPIAS